MKALKFVIRVTDPEVLEHYENNGDNSLITDFQEFMDAYIALVGTTIEVEREEKYRFLHQGEMIKSGDEFLEDDAETWVPAKGVWIGVHCSTQVMMPIRRREE